MHKTILLIDDELDVLESHRLLLEAHGFAVLTAQNGEMGIQLAKNYDLDLIVVDLLMPGMNGFQVIENLRFSIPNNCPIFLLTGNNKEAHQDYARILGANECLQKPLNFDEFFAVAKNYCPMFDLPLANYPIKSA